MVVPKKVLVLGAGISGLASAWYLKKLMGDQVEITILEKSDRVGGWIKTVEQDGFLFELGPRSLRGQGNGLCSLSLAKDLGLEAIVADSTSANRYTLRNGKLRRLGLADPRLLFALLLEPFRRRGGGEETVDGFFRRRFGSYVAENLVDPFVTGIFAGDSKRLSLRACFPQLHQWEADHGSVLRGVWSARGAEAHPLFTFKDGMEALPRSLAEQLDVQFIFGAGVEKICNTEVVTNRGVFRADHIISTIPSSDLVRASVVVVNIGWRQNLLNRRGFGYLVPSSEGGNVLGVVWDSSVFTEHNRHPEETRLTVMMGGMRNPKLIDLPEQNIRNLALQSINAHLGIGDKPDAIRVTYQRQAIPQYPLGHRRPVQSSELILLGNSFHGIGVNDCIAQAEKEMRALSRKIMYKQVN
jgi:oxygen-dependent protoporphyrinogen oxidase